MTTQLTDTAVVFDRAAWLEERTGYLGGTDISAILGRNPYRAAVQVYEEKRGLAEAADPTPQMRRGTRAEPYLAETYSELTGRAIEKCGTFRHPEKPHCGVNPDYITVEGDLLVELKSHSPYVSDQYGEDGTDEVPDHEVIQTCWEMHLTGVQQCDLFVGFSWDDVRAFRLHYNPVLGKQLEDAADRFWRDYVLAECPPPLTGHPAEIEWLKKRFPQDAGTTIRATPEIEALILDLAEARSGRVAAEKVEDGIKVLIQQFMGDNAILEWSDPKPLTWKTAKPSDVTDWKAVSRALNASAELIAAHTTTKAGSRRFIVPFAKE